MENEIWKPIKNYEELYEVSSLGRVRSLDRETIDSMGRKQYFKGKVLKPQYDRYGYLYVPLNKSGKKKFKVHRLVAEAFIPNPDNKPCVDHINTNKEDNSVENLRWVTEKENSNNELTKEHISDTLIKKGYFTSNKIVQLSLDDELIKIWNSAYEIEKTGNFHHNGIARCSKGIQKQYKGFKWMYYTDYIKLNKEVG